MVSFEEAIAAGKVTSEEAFAIFDSLPPVKVEELTGLWKGSGFETGCPSDGLLERSGWFGKRFTDANSVDPLVFNANDGGVFAADPVKTMAAAAQGAYLPDKQVECETKEPKARLRVIVYRGVPTASMVYNELPIIDSFRRVDDDILLGVMDNVQMPGPPFFFVLRRNN
ncbi:hypothetical protein ACJ41O_010365 [Fusarium nematophilum]